MEPGATDHGHAGDWCRANERGHAPPPDDDADGNVASSLHPHDEDGGGPDDHGHVRASPPRDGAYAHVSPW